MKTIDLEQVDHRITEFLQAQHREEPILLTKGMDAVGLLLNLPEGIKGSEVDEVSWYQGFDGLTHVIIQARCSSEHGVRANRRAGVRELSGNVDNRFRGRRTPEGL